MTSPAPQTCSARCGCPRHTLHPARSHVGRACAIALALWVARYEAL